MMAYLKIEARWLRFAALAPLVIVCAACGDDDAATSSGCGSDADCKGDRICVQAACVDPDATAADGGGAPHPKLNAGASAAGAGSSGGGGGVRALRDVIDDPELEAACSDNCRARKEAACAGDPTSLDQCLAQCLVIDEANFGYCLDEQRDQYACLARGGYSCGGANPLPNSTCYVESMALAACGQTIPCRRYCDANAGGCLGDSGSDCMTACMQATAEASSSRTICSHYYSQLLYCWSMHPACEAGKPTVTGCTAQAAEVADCLERDASCTGYCWAAELLGCGADACMSECQSKLDDTRCGYRYRSVLSCAVEYDELNLACASGEPAPTMACASNQQEYQTCLDGL